MANTAPTVSIQQVTIQGLLRNLQDTFKAPAHLLTTSDRWRLAQIVNQFKTKGVALPLIFLKPSNFALSTTSYNPGSLRRRGIYGGISSDSSTVLNIPAIPVDMTFEVVYLTTDFYEVLEYCSTWLLASRDASLNTTVTYSDVDIDIKVIVDPSISVPERDNSADVPNTYELTSNLNIATYFTAPPESMRSVDIVTKVNAVPRDYLSKEPYA